MSWGRVVCIVAAALGLGTLQTAGDRRADAATATANSVASWCRPTTSTSDLNRMFDGDPGGIVGADYPRTLALPDDRVLWTFQDPLVKAPPVTGAVRNLHNAAVVQDGNCFEFLRSGTASNPRPWLVADLTITERQWFWPLASMLSADERTVHVILAQMFEQSATGYLTRAVPNSVVVVDLDATTLAVTGGPYTPPWGVLAPGDPTLYGWSAESAGNWTYLLGHCHRQFGFDEHPFFRDLFIHDLTCGPRVRLARVPRGRVTGPIEYWTGSSWSTDRSRARSILPESRVGITQPSQLQYVNGRWMAVTKVDDWWGDRIVVDQADKVTGPWRQTSSFRVFPKTVGACASDPFGCNTYFSSFVDDPDRELDDPVVISLSHNLWSGAASSQYRPTYLTIDPPMGRAALADRCSLDQC